MSHDCSQIITKQNRLLSEPLIYKAFLENLITTIYHILGDVALIICTNIYYMKFFKQISTLT